MRSFGKQIESELKAQGHHVKTFNNSSEPDSGLRGAFTSGGTSNKKTTYEFVREKVREDPSMEMLDICHQNLKNAGISNPCELIHGYIQDVSNTKQFDAVLSILVGHFIPRDDRIAFYTDMQQRLKTGGYFINTEISSDLNSAEFPDMLRAWKTLQMQMGGTDDSIKNIPHLLKNILSVTSPEETENFIRSSGIEQPVRFFQAFMIVGWFGIKG